ncbi:zinc-dependent metalloprotease [Chitinophagaceae bacterium LB-8]|uniref:Zinc-dependent metalloprotease n=1 Tax=Paraflavisolibacter caeni TaxID=2982496 RepID=A0A9X2XPR8_9BACT|nr:M57 family metalloprotease [Paraflavisolibacter caeni]MCU7551624.1 zinc-dependent metalloprotease [Paraflavisolibacter caeni]
MKNWISSFAGVCLLAYSLVACVKDTKQVATPAEPVSSETIAKIAALGFGTAEVQRIDEGYLVEGDIVLTEADLSAVRPATPSLVIAQEEQYNTNNLVRVNTKRNITVSVSGDVPSGFSNAVNAALARYNTLNLTITFSRVASGGNIDIRIVNSGQYIASAGFPTNSGDPYSQVKYSRKYINYSAGFMTTVVAHEIGHCIGFRHTDYMNRSYSCGIGGNEGDGGVGANHIPGTPTGPDAKSWMLACLSSTTDRPFNNNDKTALNYLY